MLVLVVMWLTTILVGQFSVAGQVRLNDVYEPAVSTVPLRHTKSSRDAPCNALQKTMKAMWSLAISIDSSKSKSIL